MGRLIDMILMWSNIMLNCGKLYIFAKFKIYNIIKVKNEKYLILLLMSNKCKIYFKENFIIFL